MIRLYPICPHCGRVLKVVGKNEKGFDIYDCSCGKKVTFTTMDVLPSTSVDTTCPIRC